MLPIAPIPGSLAVVLSGWAVPAELISQLTPGGLLALVVLLVLSGRLVTARQFTALERERDYWREIALRTTDQTAKLMPAAEIATHVTRALSNRADASDGGKLE